MTDFVVIRQTEESDFAIRVRQYLRAGYGFVGDIRTVSTNTHVHHVAYMSKEE